MSQQQDDQQKSTAGPETQDCPPGLENLSQIDKLIIKREGKEYKIKNSSDQQVYIATAATESCMQKWIGSIGGFTMHISDNTDQEVIRVSREFNCCAGCQWFSCTEQCTIEAPEGNIVGYVKQRPSCLEHRFSILDANHEDILSCACPPFGYVIPCFKPAFNVLSCDGENEVGKISKTKNTFGVSFPMDLDVKIKAVMIGTVFLIGFLFFEGRKNPIIKRIRKELCDHLKEEAEAELDI